MQYNLQGELTLMDNLDIKPNYAALGRKYGIDWMTVKKYHEGYKGKPIIDQYLCPNSYRVSNEPLIRYGNNKYSVDPKFIDEVVTIDTLENNLYIYYNGKLITYHPLNEKN